MVPFICGFFNICGVVRSHLHALFSLNWSYCMLAALRSNRFGWEGLISLSLHLFERFWEQGLHSSSTFFSLLLSALAFLALQFYSSPLFLLFWFKLAHFSDLKVDWRYAKDCLLRALALRRVWRSQEIWYPWAHISFSSWFWGCLTCPF